MKAGWLVAAFLSAASAHAVAQTSVVGAASNDTMTKAELTERLATSTPVALCKKDTPMRMCFSTTAEQCEVAMASAMRACTQRFDEKIPAKMTQGQAKQLGEWIGQCAVDAVETAQPDAKQDSPGCRTVASK